VTWATSVPILVFLSLSVLELGPMYGTDRRQTKASLNASTPRGVGIIIIIITESLKETSATAAEPTVSRPTTEYCRGIVQW